MRILYFTKGDVSIASSNERVWIIAELLQKRYRVEYAIIPALSATPAVVFKSVMRGSYDVVVVHKSLYSWKTVISILVACFTRRCPLVFELDDAQWIHSPRKSILFARFASCIIAGSSEIESWARRHNGYVIRIPTAVDHAHFAAHRVVHKAKGVYTIGWVGGGISHFKGGNLQIIRLALDELARRGRRFRFMLVGAQDHEPLIAYFASNTYEFVPITFVPYRDIPLQIQLFDVGVMPLLDTPFERGKCAAKAVQYMACGVPAVVSSVGENTNVVEDGKTGFVVSTTDEWVHAIETLLSDDALRNRMGSEGMEKVRRLYSYEAVLPKYNEVLYGISK